ncbi:MAG: glutamyl-tRNA reductase [Planctomycetota bacterium]|nr:glutamyl-tRNA reductase [Planctomycetota bacterium]
MSETPRLEEALRLVGLSHFTAPVALRERLAFRAADLPRALGAVLARGFLEAAILSTCNRVEIIAVGRPNNPEPGGQIRTFLSEFHGVGESEFSPSLYELKGCAAAQHLFEVTASLDSQVLGETEILAQAKEAYRAAAAAGACGRVLHRLFERSFFLSKELRTDGGIGKVQASVSSAAVALANKLFDVKGRKVLVIGTGEMAAGIVRTLRAAGVGEVFVASRTEARAAEFAKQEGGKPCSIHQLPEYLTLVDIVLVSAAAPNYILGPAQVRAATSPRRGRVLCLIDISVPRNVDPAVGELDDAFLYDIDDLEEVAKEGRLEREKVAERWRPRLAEEARECLHALESYGVEEAAQKLIEHFNAVRQDVLRQTRIAGGDPKIAEETARALERLQGRLLHGPLETLKQAAREGDGGEATAWVSRLFRLGLPAGGKSGKEDGQP